VQLRDGSLLRIKMNHLEMLRERWLAVRNLSIPEWVREAARGVLLDAAFGATPSEDDIRAGLAALDLSAEAEVITTIGMDIHVGVAHASNIVRWNGVWKGSNPESGL
jgi:hypothetical protein